MFPCLVSRPMRSTCWEAYSVVGAGARGAACLVWEKIEPRLIWSGGGPRG